MANYHNPKAIGLELLPPGTGAAIAEAAETFRYYERAHYAKAHKLRRWKWLFPSEYAPRVAKAEGNKESAEKLEAILGWKSVPQV